MAQLDQDGSPADGYTEARLLTTTGENSFVVQPGFGTVASTVYALTAAGNATDYVQFQAALTAMALVGGKVVLKAGTYTITDNVTGASNVVVEFMPGAVLDISSTKTVTLAGEVVTYGRDVSTGLGALACVQTRVDGAVYVLPRGGTTDDWPYLATLLQTHKAVILDPNSTYLCKTAWTAGQIPNGRTIHVNGATIVSSLTPSVSTNQQSVFYFNAVISGNYGALTEAPVVGSSTIKVVRDTAPQVGEIVRWGVFENNIDQQATIRAVSTSGNNIHTLTLDEVVKITATVSYGITKWMGTYSAGTTYAAGEAVISGTTVYVSKVGSNIGNTPASSPTQWFQCVARFASFTVPQDIAIIGPGTISGTGDRPFEFGCGIRCTVDGISGFSVAAGFTTACNSWDSTCRDCVMRRVTYDGGYGLGGVVSTWGFACESDKRCGYEYCTARHVGDSAGEAGFLVLAGTNFWLTNCSAENCYEGCLVSSITAGDYNAGQYGSIRDCFFEGNRNDGMQLVDGVRYVAIGGVQCNYNTRYGIYSYIGGGLQPEHVHIESAFLVGNGDDGLHVGNASRLTAGEITCKGNGRYGIGIIDTGQLVAAVVNSQGNTKGAVRNNSTAAGLLSIGQLFTREELVYDTGNAYGHVICLNGSRTYIGRGDHEDLTGVIAANGGVYYVDDAATILEVTSAWARIANTSFVSMCMCGISNAGTKCRATFGTAVAERSSGTSGVAFYIISHGEIALGQGSRSIGAWANGCYAVDATGTFVIGTGVDFSSSTSPYPSVGAQSPNGGPPSFNFGTVTLNGATPVDVAYTPIHANNTVTLTMKTVGGTQGVAPRVAITAGTKFTVTGIALDTSTLTYRIL